MARRVAAKRRPAEHLVSTPARPTRCPRCRAPVLAGLDRGLPTRVEPTAVDAAGELRALMAGLWTYASIGGELRHREAWHIRAGPPTGGVWVMHDCAGIRFAS